LHYKPLCKHTREICEIKYVEFFTIRNLIQGLKFHANEGGYFTKIWSDLNNRVEL